MAVTINSPKATPRRQPGLTPVAPDPALMQIDEAMLHRRHILALTGLSAKTIERRIQRGDFPKPDHFDGRHPLWRVATYRAWAASTPIERAKQHVAKLEAEGEPSKLAKAHVASAHRLK